MAELSKAVGVNIPLVERLVKKHFGPEFTSHLTWSFLKGRYVPSDLPGRVAVPQKLLGIRLWWKAIGQFSDNIGFRLELWDPTFLGQAQAFAEEYNAQSTDARVELYCAFTGSLTAGRPAAA